MACARCDLYLPKESNSTQLLEAKNSLQRMLVTIPLTDDERAAVEGDEQAVDRLIDARHCRSSGSRTGTERARPQTRRTKEQANERMSRSHRSAWERANDRLARERASVPMPDQLHWDHNAHYHSYLLRQLPPRFVRALDVGCGAGAFARLLARRAVVVDAIDLSPVMIAQASAASSQPPNIRWVEGDALALALGPERYEVITAIASVLTCRSTMRFDASATCYVLCPGGVLAILGHYRPVTASDYALSALAPIANPIVGAWQAATGRRLPPPDDMPVRDPATTLAEINAAAERHLPGSIVRRHLFYRYSLIWRGER